MNFEQLKNIKLYISRLGVNVGFAKNSRPVDLTSQLDMHPLTVSYLGQKKACLVKVRSEDTVHMEWSAFSLREDSFSPFYQTLVEYVSGVHTNYEGSVLEMFYRLYQPKSARDVIGTGTAESIVEAHPMSAPLLWSNLALKELEQVRKQIARREGKSFGLGRNNVEDLMMGPVSIERGRVEYQRLVNTLESISKRGFKVHGEGFNNIQAHCIYDEHKNVWKYFVYSGHHRVAALAALGIKEFTLQLNPWSFGYSFRRSDLPYSPNVLRGVLTKDEAYEYFDRVVSAKQQSAMYGYIDFIKERIANRVNE